MSKAKVVNLTEREIHIPLYMVSKNLSVGRSVCLSVRLNKLRPKLSQDWQNRMGCILPLFYHVRSSRNGKMGLLRQFFRVKSNFKHKNCYPTQSFTIHGGMKFAIQISRLLNFIRNLVITIINFEILF